MSRLRDVSDFISSSRAASSADELRTLMESITRDMGFDSYSLFQHVAHFSWKKKRTLALSNFSRSWLDQFLSQRMYADDPVFLASHRTAIGFRFDEIPAMIRLTPRQQEILRLGRESGVADGFCVPVHIPGETNGTCTFAVKQGELPADNLPMAQLVGSFAYEAARQLMLRGEGILEREEPKPLTSRQLECVALVGRGKSDWEIGQILGIREGTVTDHLNDARRRVGVSRRAELPIHALFRGELTFSDIIH